MPDRQQGDLGFLPAIAAGTACVFYLVWAAMHDIAHGESDCAFEYAALVTGALAFLFLYRMALRLLSLREKTLWFGGTGLLLLLFNLGAIHAKLRPKYPLDPMLGSAFLVAGIPALALIGYHLARESGSSSRTVASNVEILRTHLQALAGALRHIGIRDHADHRLQVRKKQLPLGASGAARREHPAHGGALQQPHKCLAVAAGERIQVAAQFRELLPQTERKPFFEDTTVQTRQRFCEPGGQDLVGLRVDEETRSAIPVRGDQQQPVKLRGTASQPAAQAEFVILPRHSSGVHNRRKFYYF